MRKLHQLVSACTLGAIALSASVFAADPPAVESGKDIMFNRAKGNCLACHALPTVPDAQSAGHFGPPLIAMSARYPDKAKLRAQIWDPTVANPGTSMIPFGKHHVLTEQEIDKVADFVYGL